MNEEQTLTKCSPQMKNLSEFFFSFVVFERFTPVWAPSVQAYGNPRWNVFLLKRNSCFSKADGDAFLTKRFGWFKTLFLWVQAISLINVGTKVRAGLADAAWINLGRVHHGSPSTTAANGNGIDGGDAGAAKAGIQFLNEPKNLADSIDFPRLEPFVGHLWYVPDRQTSSFSNFATTLSFRPNKL
ncbi:hypothetical protein [Maribacter sp. 2307ULW6-5]|uniref:hypothetical protein n=1 Tax=Maribacter sp. 2307ULW6-5 TaxID=3386275 RepID=UPI0039BD5E53